MSLGGTCTLQLSLVSTTPCIVFINIVCVALQAFEIFSPGSEPSSPLRTLEPPRWSCKRESEVGGCDGRSGSAGSGQAVFRQASRSGAGMGGTETAGKNDAGYRELVTCARSCRPLSGGHCAWVLSLPTVCFLLCLQEAFLC